jgi:hypothetical protein
MRHRLDESFYALFTIVIGIAGGALLIAALFGAA